MNTARSDSPTENCIEPRQIEARVAVAPRINKIAITVILYPGDRMMPLCLTCVSLDRSFHLPIKKAHPKGCAILSYNRPTETPLPRIGNLYGRSPDSPSPSAILPAFAVVLRRRPAHSSGCCSGISPDSLFTQDVTTRFVFNWHRAPTGAFNATNFIVSYFQWGFNPSIPPSQISQGSSAYPRHCRGARRCNKQRAERVQWRESM